MGAWLRAIPINELIGGVTIAPHCAELRLFNNAALACSRSGRRRTDLLLLRFLREVGFSFMIRGLQTTDQ
jgi:hypothetical protein